MAKKRLQQIYLIYNNYGQKIKNFVQTNFRTNTCKFEYVKMQCESMGDVIRFMDEKNIIKDQKGPPFLLVASATITNINVKQLYDQHRIVFTYFLVMFFRNADPRNSPKISSE